MHKLIETWFAPIITGLLATVLGGIALFWLTFDELKPAGASITPSVASTHFPTPSLEQWESLKNEASYARNYVRKEKRSFELYPQVVTIYETPMTTDRREGKKIASGEYLQIFKVGNQSDVVIQIRVDKGNYWLLSRQRVDLSEDRWLISLNPEKDDKTFDQFHVNLQNMIDSTRHFLKLKL